MDAALSPGDVTAARHVVWTFAGWAAQMVPLLSHIASDDGEMNPEEWFGQNLCAGFEADIAIRLANNAAEDLWACEVLGEWYPEIRDQAGWRFMQECHLSGAQYLPEATDRAPLDPDLRAHIQRQALAVVMARPVDELATRQRINRQKLDAVSRSTEELGDFISGLIAEEEQRKTLIRHLEPALVEAGLWCGWFGASSLFWRAAVAEDDNGVSAVEWAQVTLTGSDDARVGIARTADALRAIAKEWPELQSNPGYQFTVGLAGDLTTCGVLDEAFNVPLTSRAYERINRQMMAAVSAPGAPSVDAASLRDAIRAVDSLRDWLTVMTGTTAT